MDRNIEDTEFKDPRLPAYVDMEYVEVGYAITKKYGGGASSAYLGWWSLKKLSESVGAGGTSGVNHPPNKNGLQIGILIAEKYRDISHFAEEFCRAAPK